MITGQCAVQFYTDQEPAAGLRNCVWVGGRCYVGDYALTSLCFCGFIEAVANWKEHSFLIERKSEFRGFATGLSIGPVNS